MVSAFQKAGIISLNAELILEKLRRLEPPILSVARDNAAAETTTTYTRPSSPAVSSTLATPTTVRSLKRQGEELLKCDMDPEFRKKLTTYIKGSQAQAERGALALQHVDLTEVAMRARSLRQKRSRTCLQNGGAVTVEQARQLARSRAQRTEEKARAEVERELNQKKRRKEKEAKTKKKEERKKKREEDRKQREENAQKRKEEQATRKA
jgi:flagellar biosynthesis GTPase FlhF